MTSDVDFHFDDRLWQHTSVKRTSEWRVGSSSISNIFCYEISNFILLQASFILCRLFVKSTCRNNNSEHVLSSCGEGSVGTLRHIGIQHDGTITSGIGEGSVRDETSVDKKNEVLEGNVGTAGAVAHTGVQVPSSVQPNEPVF